MKAVISYITKFLIGGEKADVLASLVGYTSDPNKFSRYRVVIIPSPFFRDEVYGTAESMPKLPLEEIEGVPLLFGSPKIEWQGDTWVVHADIIASAYFLLTRYEEIRKRNIRDIHGRFLGTESLPFKAGFIHRPIVDEYGKLLRRWLRQARVQSAVELPPHIQKVWLTHDVDAPFFCRTFRNLIRETIKGTGLKHAWKMFHGSLQEDPFYTFPWLVKQRNKLKAVIGKHCCESLFFIKSGGSSVYDKPHYKLHSKDLQELLLFCKTEKVQIGLHTSYDAGKTPALISTEKELLERQTGKSVTYNRHHYLASREPEDMVWLEKAGITDDFTMGYPDVAGFRLGTSRPVHWINPENKRISPLILHPLAIMECSLNEPVYMNLDYEGALAYSTQLIKQVASANGELVLLWHNDSITTRIKPNVSVDWQRKLFAAIIEELIKS